MGIEQFIRRKFQETRLQSRLVASMSLRRFGLPLDLRCYVMDLVPDMKDWVEDERARPIRTAQKDSAWLRDACRLPLMLTFVCMIGGELKSEEALTKTKIYGRVVDKMITRFIDKEQERMEIKERKRVKTKNLVRKALGKIAWKSFKKGELFISAEELEEDFEDEFALLTTSGLLCGQGETMFSWSHFTLQEYMAAVHASKMKNAGAELKRLREDQGEKSDVFFRFLCGMGGEAMESVKEWCPTMFVQYEQVNESGPLGWLEEEVTKPKRLRDVVVGQLEEFDKAGKEAALREAAKEGWKSAMKLAVEKGADVNAADKDGVTALMLASEKGHLEVAKWLVEKGDDVNAADLRGTTAYMWACANGHLEVAKWLEEKGADVSAADGRGRTALMEASGNGHLEVAKWLEEKGADVNAADNYSRTTAFMWACANGHLEVAKWLVEKGADVNVADETGRTALMWVSVNGHLEVAKWLEEKLEEKGANVNAAERHGAMGDE
jgi:ankyrin repeat protein